MKRSVDGTKMFRAGTLVLAATGIWGCLQTDPAAVPAREVGHRSQDSTWTRLKALEIRDPATGETYLQDPWSEQRLLLNPNRRLVLPDRDPAPLAKASGLVNSQVDVSGRIETRWYECKSATTAAVHQFIACQVEPGFVLVGGGAYVDYEMGPGALLTASAPLDLSQTTWMASSKQHQRDNRHTLYVYAIGMRVKLDNGTYMDEMSLRHHVRTDYQVTSGNQAYPTLTVAAPAGFKVIGGGVRALTYGSGQLLTRSDVDVAANGWAGQSKDQSISSPGSIMVLVISVTVNPIIGFGRFDARSWTSGTTTYSKQVGVNKITSFPGYVMTCPGGNANGEMLSTPPNRLLFGLRPEFQAQGQGMAVAYDKDHVSAGKGYLTATAMILFRQAI